MSDATLVQRIDIHATDPEAYKPMFAMEKYVHAGSLGEELISLIKLRASQINGCAYCLDMHGREARAAGVAQRQIDVLPGWHEAPSLYTARQQAAIALTEEMTLISEGGVSDEVWSEVRGNFEEKEIPQLVMAICAINTWNRIAIASHMTLPEKPAK